MGGFLLVQKLKKTFAILLIVCLLPYIITIFMSGKESVSGQVSELDDYCIGALAKEVSSAYEDEMLRVQAVIVRTTIYQNAEEILSQENVEEEYHLDKNTSWYQRLRRAWNSTEGQVLMYGEELALLPFHYLSNGKTRNGAEALQSEAYPYLKVRECLVDIEAEEQLQTKMISITDAEIVKTDSAGYVLQVKVGEEIQSGEQFRAAHGLASSCFEFQIFETATRVTTKGVGHGLGLSQYSANEMAKEGKTYQEILQHFYEGTTLQEVAEVLWQTE